ncbi:MAG TPA: DUF4173 domain-containing protein [Gemmatimonadales bacterium]|nr:DUF4173 domain-containing protein [Gemmatimonadales bacterium]
MTAISPAESHPVRANFRPQPILGHALLVAIAADALLRSRPALGLPIWIGVLALAAISLAWRTGRVVPVQAAGWLLVALLFSAGFAWRDSEALRLLDAAVVLGALGMAALALSDGRTALFANRLRDTVWGAGAMMLTIAAGPAPLGLFSADHRTGLRNRFGPAARAALIIVAILLVFGSLLRGADPIFASVVALPGIDVDEVVSHAVFIAFFAWIGAGWARGAFVADLRKHSAPDQWPISLGLLDITAALGTLILLFATFVATQLGWFFGGERFLRERTGLTAAEYARGGFFQMVWVVFLVAGVLLGTRGMLRPGSRLARRHTALSLPVVVLLAAIIFSAAMRMRLYVHYYGLTLDRFDTLVFMGWLGIVLVWLTLTVLRGWGRPFVAGAALSGLATLALLHVVSPDVVVARVNLARAAGPEPGPPLDLVHLASLSGEAADLVVEATLSPSSNAPADQRCEAARRLLKRWGPASPLAALQGRAAAWRSWNAGESSALRIVAGHTAQLQAVCHPPQESIDKP